MREIFLHRLRSIVVAGLFSGFAVSAYAQSPPPTNPEVVSIIKDISGGRIEKTVNHLVDFGTRHTLSDTVSDSKGIGAARRWLKSQFDNIAADSKGRMTVEYVSGMSPVSARIPSSVKIVNIVATLSPTSITAGSSPRIYIVGAHYDSRCTDVMDSTDASPGADDDGSGTALVLELARVLSKHDFKATIKFILYAGEEQGLFGSTILADTALRERWNIDGVFNNDIVGATTDGDGRSEDGYVRVFSQSYSRADSGSTLRQDIALGYDNDGRSRSLARYIEETDYRYKSDLPHSFGVHMIYRLDRFLRGGDQTPFHNAGFAAVRFTEAKENFNHQHQNLRAENGIDYGDLPKYMDFNYCANVARVNAAAIASLAFAPDPPRNVRLVNKDLGYDTDLTWSNSDDPDLTGYYVRWRNTTSPTWEHALLVKDSTVTIPISKDDVIFSVQSADNDGDLSMYVLPIPGK